MNEKHIEKIPSIVIHDNQSGDCWYMSLPCDRHYFTFTSCRVAMPSAHVTDCHM